MSSHKTIDGRGQRIKLTGKGLRLKECEHVIICNLEFEGGRGHDVDAIQIKPNSKHIWIDRCTLADYDDGLIDITRESTDITVSRYHKMSCFLMYIFLLCFLLRTLAKESNKWELLVHSELYRELLVLDCEGVCCSYTFK